MSEEIIKTTFRNLNINRSNSHRLIFRDDSAKELLVLTTSLQPQTDVTATSDVYISDERRISVHWFFKVTSLKVRSIERSEIAPVDRAQIDTFVYIEQCHSFCGRRVYCNKMLQICSALQNSFTIPPQSLRESIPPMQFPIMERNKFNIKMLISKQLLHVPWLVVYFGLM